MTSGVCMQQLSVWVGTGIVTAVSRRHCLREPGRRLRTRKIGSKSGGVSSSESTTSGAAKPDSTSRKRPPIPRAPAPSPSRTRTRTRPDVPARRPRHQERRHEERHGRRHGERRHEERRHEKDDESTSDSTDPDDEAAPTSPVKPTAEAPKNKSATAEPLIQKPRKPTKAKAAKEPIESEEPSRPRTHRSNTYTTKKTFCCCCWLGVRSGGCCLCLLWVVVVRVFVAMGCVWAAGRARAPVGCWGGLCCWGRRGRGGAGAAVGRERVFVAWAWCIWPRG